MTIKAAGGKRAAAAVWSFWIIGAMQTDEMLTPFGVRLVLLNIVLFVVSCALFFAGFYEWLQDCDASECVGHAGSIVAGMLRVYAEDQYAENPSLAVAAVFAVMFVLACFSVNVVVLVVKCAASCTSDVLGLLASHPYFVGATTGLLLFLFQLYSFFNTSWEYESSRLNCTVVCPELGVDENRPLFLIWVGILASGLLVALNFYLVAQKCKQD